MQSAVAGSVPFPGSDTLQALAARALRELAAEGVAIALSREGEIVCEASEGAAPDVGTKLASSSTLSAECMRTGKPVSDAEGSVLLVPVLDAGKAIGLCVAFSPSGSPGIDAHMERLTEIARAVAELQQAAAPPAPGLSQATLQQVEEAIADFAREEKRRRIIRKAQKIAGLALATCLIAAAFVPDRVSAWVTPILHRLERSHPPNVETRDRSR